MARMKIAKVNDSPVNESPFDVMDSNITYLVCQMKSLDGVQELLQEPLTGDIGFAAHKVMSLKGMSVEDIVFYGNMELAKRWYRPDHALRVHPVQLRVKAVGVDTFDIELRIFRSHEQALHAKAVRRAAQAEEAAAVTDAAAAASTGAARSSRDKRRK